jgi:hypothetical protein
MAPTRRRARPMLILGVVAVAIAALVGWLYWSGHQVWSSLDNAADDFGVPEGFSELQRVRSGEAVCFVTCTGGGEAVVTVILDPGSLTEDEACSRMEDAVRESLADAGSVLEPPLGLYQCDFGGPLEGTMWIGGVVARAADLRPDGGERWLEDEAVPELPVVAWVQFNSGIE